MITVITPTVRPEGLKLVEKALRRQSFTDFEWIVVSPQKPTNIVNFVWVKDPGKNEGDYWSVYKSYNAGLRVAKGELIISVQDYTFFEPDALEKFWFYYQKEPKTLVSGVGGKYSDDTWTTKTWADPRERNDQTTFYPCYFNDIEWNFCSVPKKAIYAVGGFDESLDKYSSLCGLDVLARLHIIGGWDFKLDQTNKTYSLEHGRLPDWEETLPFNGPWQQKLVEYKEKPVLDYLIDTSVPTVLN